MLSTNGHLYESALAISEGLDLYLTDVVKGYLYGSINNDIYMKIYEEFKLLGENSTKPHNIYFIKLQ